MELVELVLLRDITQPILIVVQVVMKGIKKAALSAEEKWSDDFVENRELNERAEMPGYKYHWGDNVEHAQLMNDLEQIIQSKYNDERNGKCMQKLSLQLIVECLETHSDSPTGELIMQYPMDYKQTKQ